MPNRQADMKEPVVTKEFTDSFRRHPVKRALGVLIDVGGLTVIVFHLASLV